MNLLEHVIEACGGIEAWRQLRRFTAHLSLRSAVLTRNGKSGLLGDIVVEGCTKLQRLQIPCFTAPNRRAYYHPHRVAIEHSDGTLLEERHGPGLAFTHHAGETQWDDLQLAYYCGCWTWNVLTDPFLLAGPDFHAEELPTWVENGETWRRLKVRFPTGTAARIGTKVFYFDRNWLQRRVDHDPADWGGVAIAQYCWAHHRFSGILVPTLHRCTTVSDTGSAVQSDFGPDIEVFDVVYE
jgi:hypothetical protein